MSRRAQIVLVSAAAALAAAALPTSAAASTASEAGSVLVYAAAAGETNNVTVSETGANFDITDPGATITPTAPCAAVSAHEVTCPVAGVVSIRVVGGNMNDTETIASSVSLPPLVSGSPPLNLQGDDGDDTLTTASSTPAVLVGDSGGSGTGNDTLNGGPVRDTLVGDGGNDTMHGSGGDDSLIPGPGNDTAFGDEGGDNFQTGAAPDGADTYNGGPGDDFIAYSSRSAPVSVSLDGVANDGESGEGDNVMPDVESVDGGSAGDVLTGDAGDNFLGGEGGNDVIDGGDGADGLNGGPGNDLITGGDGNDQIVGDTGTDMMSGGNGDDTFISNEVSDQQDVLSGGAGTDLADYSGANAAVNVSLDGVANDGVQGENDNVLPDVEDVLGTNRDDTLTGSAAANDLEGNGGADTIAGLGGADGLYGGGGPDVIDGGTGTDLLDGGAEGDLIRSRDGEADEVACGGGSDAVLANQGDQLQADCELASNGLAFKTTNAKVKPSGRAKVKLACPAVEFITCRGTLVLSAPRASNLATAKVSIPGGTTKAVRLEISPKKLANRRRITTTATATMTDASGAAAVTTEQLVLVRKRG